MRVTLSGDLGSGKSSVGRLLAEKLGVPHYSAGTLFREIGHISNLDALQTNLAAENNAEIDHAVDGRTREIDRDVPSFIIDSRMAWHFVSNATRVYLSVSPRTAAERVMSDTARSRERYENLDSAIASLEKRRESEIRRYANLYGVDITNVDNYDLFIITDDAAIGDIAAVILAFAEGRTREKFWLPKARIVPMIGLDRAPAVKTRLTMSDRFRLRLVIAGNFGFYQGNPAPLVSAFSHDHPIVPYAPVPTAEGALERARRLVKPEDLSAWQRAASVDLAFERYLAAIQ